MARGRSNANPLPRAVSSLMPAAAGEARPAPTQAARPRRRRPPAPKTRRRQGRAASAANRLAGSRRVQPRPGRHGWGGWWSRCALACAGPAETMEPQAGIPRVPPQRGGVFPWVIPLSLSPGPAGRRPQGAGAQNPPPPLNRNMQAGPPEPARAASEASAGPALMDEQCRVRGTRETAVLRRPGGRAWFDQQR